MTATALSEDTIRRIFREELQKVLAVFKNPSEDALPSAGEAEPPAVQRKAVYQIGACTLDMGRLSLTRNGSEIRLPATEMLMLGYLAQNAGYVCTREELYQAGHHGEPMPGPLNRSVDTAIASIRKAVEPISGEQNIIITVTGCGYRLSAMPSWGTTTKGAV